jgi:GH24 family phage-related lysozyme (muramidase)
MVKRLLFLLLMVVFVNAQDQRPLGRVPSTLTIGDSLGRINADAIETSAASDGTRYWDFLVDMRADPAASAEVNGGYFRINKTDGSNGVYTLNGLEGVAGSSYADEAGTFRGVYGRTYTNADATSTMRTAVGGEFSARASYNGGTECVAENGTAFVGSRIWMAPYFTDASLSNINNFHGLWIYNEATAKKVTNGIMINDAGGTGGFTNGINLAGVLDIGLKMSGTIAKLVDLDIVETSAAATETRYFDVLVDGQTDPAASGEVNAGYFAYNKTDGSNGVYTINALEGVARSSYADEAGTFRGVYGRIYINADATSTMRTGIGGEFSARAGYNGGTAVVAENGTAFVGARIWMAPYFSAGSLGNINNFHGLWLYNENNTNTVTNAIYVDDVGGTGGWTNGINFSGAVIGTAEFVGSNGETIDNVSDGIIKVSGSITQEDYVIRKFVSITGATDNTATNFFTITTTDETGSTDGGGYIAKILVMAAQDLGSDSTNVATMSLDAHFARVMQAAGTGANSAVAEISQSAEAAGGTGGVNQITLTVVETSEFVQTVQIQIDVDGGTADASAIVELVWSSFLTAPVIASS